ncbi:transglutaminase domain-containing protein [Solibacillus sp. FSL K6-1554]|uniref:transglutaminase domain-containing protein n=1 Tax=Solibacillus sp. FSL K6-1554 TaxID=2921472 RepID=UPI0030FCC932
MKHQKYTALFLAGAASVVISSEIYAAPINDNDYQPESEQFVTSEVISSSPLAHTPRVTHSAGAVEAVPTITSETELVDYIINKMENLEAVFEVRYVGNTSDLIANKKLLQLIKEAQNENDYLLGIGSAVGYNASYTSNEANLKFTTSYFITQAQQKFVDAEVARINAQILRPNMTDLEKVIAINEYIVKNTTYSYSSSTTPHAAYALFKEGKGVCQAYAMAAYHMFKAAGLETHYVTGYAGEDHAWNLVKVNGQWYHIDPTWNDPTFSTPIPGLENFISYQYFLLSDDTLLAERTMDSRPNLPRATAKNFEVFRSIESIPFKFNGIQYMLLPEYKNNQFFFVDYTNNYVINSLNLENEQLIIKQVANVRAMDILATDHAIYFVDIDNRLGLSKVDLQSKATTRLYSGGSVTSIKLENGVVKAYNNQNVVYTENVTAIEADSEIKKIANLVNTIVLPSKQFKKQADELSNLIDIASVDLQNYLSADVLNQIKYIQQQYEKMNNLFIDPKLSWAPLKKITEPLKSWTVTLSQEVANTPGNQSKITVVDMFGDEIDVDITIRKEKIMIKPNQNYVDGVPYTLVIDGGLQSNTGEKLPNRTHLTFMFGE